MSGDLKVVQLYCPNCGQLNSGYKNKNDMVLLRCRKCACCLSSKRMKEQVVVTISKKN